MPSNHSIDLRTESGMTVEDVQFSFDVALSKVRKRPFSEGYRFSVELPAVLDLLDAVADGKQSAADTRKVLLDAVNVLYDEAGCYEHETPEDKLDWCVRGGGCQTCEFYRDRFSRYLKTMAERWRRWNLPEKYPFAVGRSKGIHTVSCTVVRRRMPSGFTEHDPGDPVALRAFAHPHTYDDFYYPGFETQNLPGEVPFHLMTDEEARAWMNKNTGPKGGRHYKRCRHCAPTP